jgi:hypothetical protein
MRKCLWLFLCTLAFAQNAPIPTVSNIWNICSTANQFASCSPTQLGVNALTEPGAGTSALSTIIDTRGVRQATLAFSCTNGAITLNVQTYSEDGTTTSVLSSPVSGVAAATLAQVTIGSESNPTTSTGTLATPPAGVIRFPQRALAFSFTNAGTAGTCTARLFLLY